MITSIQVLVTYRITFMLKINTSKWENIFIYYGEKCMHCMKYEFSGPVFSRNLEKPLVLWCK